MVRPVTCEQRVCRVLRMTRVAPNFVLTSETVEPRCVGDFVEVIEVVVDMLDWLRKTTVSCPAYCVYMYDALNTPMLILKSHVGKQVIQTSMEAFITPRLFCSLFSSEETLACDRGGKDEAAGDAAVPIHNGALFRHLPLFLRDFGWGDPRSLTRNRTRMSRGSTQFFGVSAT